MNTKIYGDFQICISVTLIHFNLKTSRLAIKMNIMLFKIAKTIFEVEMVTLVQNAGSLFLVFFIARIHSELINFYSPWNHQKTIVFLMISREINRSLLIRLNLLTIRKEIWKWSHTLNSQAVLIQVYKIVNPEKQNASFIGVLINAFVPRIFHEYTKLTFKMK